MLTLRNNKLKIYQNIIHLLEISRYESFFQYVSIAILLILFFHTNRCHRKNMQGEKSSVSYELCRFIILC